MKILLADDEPIARTMLEHWLVGWGYQVTLARDGESALQALKDDPELRLLVVDWVMPKKDGIEVCKEIRSGLQEPYVYVVLLTAKDDKSDIIAGLDAGADDYLVKPCNPLELKVRLRAGRRVIELQEQLVSARESLRFEAMHDSLTGLLNRGAVLEQLSKELLRASRRGAPVSVLMGDLDHFKSINDTHGHVAGDAVLKETARRLKAGVRAYDSVGRLGGEEFIAVLPECDVFQHRADLAAQDPGKPCDVLSRDGVLLVWHRR
jgi:PleD family two-component response regulator